MGFEIRLDVIQAGDEISGEMHVKIPVKGEESFPFAGTYRNGKISIRGQDGNTFQGRLGKGGKVTGTLMLKDGRAMPVVFTVR